MTNRTNPELELEVQTGAPDEKQSDKYGTPFELYNYLNERFHFNMDPCTSADNPLCTPEFFTTQSDGLVQDWRGPVFMNPPYSKVTPWVRKAWTESLQGQLVVGLVRHDPSTQWWQQYVNGKSLVLAVPYRLIFRDPDSSVHEYRAYNFPSAVVLWLGDLSDYKPGSESENGFQGVLPNVR